MELLSQFPLLSTIQSKTLSIGRSKKISRLAVARDDQEDELVRKRLHNLATDKYSLSRQPASAQRDARIDEIKRDTEFLAAKRKAFRRGG